MITKLETLRSAPIPTIPGTNPLSAYPGDKVTVACRRCPLEARYDKAQLIARVGADHATTYLLRKIALGLKCPVAQAQEDGTALAAARGCGLYYVECAPPGWDAGRTVRKASEP